MSKVTEAVIEVCALTVAAVLLCFWFNPEVLQPKVYIQLQPTEPESSGDRVATEKAGE